MWFEWGTWEHLVVVCTICGVLWKAANIVFRSVNDGIAFFMSLRVHMQAVESRLGELIASINTLIQRNGKPL